MGIHYALIYIKNLKSYALSKMASSCFDIRAKTFAKSSVTGRVLYRLSPLFQFIFVSIKISFARVSPLAFPAKRLTNNGAGIPLDPL